MNLYKTTKYNIALILVATIFIFTTLIFVSGINPITTRGEGREGLVVQAMERQENLILPLRNGVEIPSKPPLYHWISYGYDKLTNLDTIKNIDVTSIRAPSVISASLIFLILSVFLLKRAPSIIAFLTVSILFSSLEFIRYSTQGRVDMVFTLFLAISMIGLYKYNEEKSKLTFILTTICLSLSALGKGPFGIIIPLLILGIFILFDFSKENYFERIKKLFPFIPIFLFSILLASIWYYLAYNIGGEDFLNTQLGKENVYRVVKSDTIEVGHNKPFYFSFIYLLSAILPWALFLPRIISTILQLKIFKVMLAKDSLFRFASIWLLVFLFAVTVSVSKRSVYFLPALPAFAYIFAILISNSSKANLSKIILSFEKVIFNIIYILSITLFVLLTILSILYFSGVSTSSVVSLLSLNGIQISPKVILILSYIDVSLIGIAICLLFLLFIINTFSKAKNSFFNERIETGALYFSIYFCFLFLVAQISIAPLVFEQENPESFSKVVNQEVTRDSKIYQYGGEFYALSFYLNRDVTVINDFSEIVSTGLSTYVLISEKDIKNLKLLEKHEIIQVAISNRNLANRDGKVLLVKIIT